MTQDLFQVAIRAYLDARAKYDEQFKARYSNPAKNIEECCNYIYNQVRKANRCGWNDDEIFSMAVHYYDEDTLPKGDLKPVNNVKAIINTQIEKPKTEKPAANSAPKAKKETKTAKVTKPIATPAKKAEAPKADKKGQFSLFDPFNF